MALPSPFNHNNLLRLNVRCPVCGNPYDLQKLKILGERDQQLLTYIDCGTCSTALVSILSMGPNGMVAQGLITDLTLEEVVNWEQLEAVTSDDVLLMHEFLDGDHHTLFHQRS
ncbi:MAG: hypothetical protein HY975_02635 [Candidatus Kerfeldbacteria bacterium]|nr:hypothetical protein [Candidatus Kerfeldbacteria bacterium]